MAGLTLPTALCLDAQDNILVAELCSDFLQRLPAGHNGISNRDTPSNLAVLDNEIYISEGMGLPGRPIPVGESE